MVYELCMNEIRLAKFNQVVTRLIYYISDNSKQYNFKPTLKSD